MGIRTEHITKKKSRENATATSGDGQKALESLVQELSEKLRDKFVSLSSEEIVAVLALARTTSF